MLEVRLIVRGVASLLAPFALMGSWAAGPPAPPEVAALHVSGVSLTWTATPGAVAYRYYRANLTDLPNYCATGWAITEQLTVDDIEVPPSGQGYAYLVNAVNSAGDGSLGASSGPIARLSLLDCDGDFDGIRDAQDNCPVDPNPLQEDVDFDDTGDACDFPASGVEQLGRLELRRFPGFQVNANEMWSYTSPSGEEYAIIGFRKATAIVRVTDPANPGLSGYIDGSPVDEPWRDMATYQNYAYVVSDGDGVGLQIVDLQDIDNDVAILANTTDLGAGFVDAHNVYVNEDSGFLYLAIPNLNGGLGLTAVDLNDDPTKPTIAGYWTDTDSNVRCHDLQVVTYTSGPAAGKEVAFCFAENDGLRIVDVTDKLNMFRLSKLIYPDTTYTHQGWLTEDRQYVLIGDELDERDDPDVTTTTTYVVDVSDLANPAFVTSFTNGLPSIDHNLMVRGDVVYEANYTSGLRMFGLCNVNAIQEIGFFDTRPETDALGFTGAWGVDVRLPGGAALVSDRQRGLFVLDPAAALASLDVCVTHGPLDAVCGDCIAQICVLDPGCCSSTWDAACVQAVRTVCGSLTCDESAGSCSHTLCSAGTPLSSGCDVPPASTSCVDAICAANPSCCSTEWSSACVDAVDTVCGLQCD